jgi:hypothetical protein
MSSKTVKVKRMWFIQSSKFQSLNILVTHFVKGRLGEQFPFLGVGWGEREEFLFAQIGEVYHLCHPVGSSVQRF